MSGITSGIGLISGINTAQLIEQLIALEQTPVRNLRTRVSAVDAQRAAYAQLSAQLLAMQDAASSFDRPSFFQRFTATSSEPTVVTATASSQAVAGSYSFRVHSLVSNHAAVSRGFSDADRTPVGAGALTIEVGNGRVSPHTPLSHLNGGAGVRRGIIEITDRTGARAEIDLSQAVTVTDVIEAINANTTVNVRARVTGVASNGASGDRIVIEDLNGSAVTGRLTVTDKNGGFMALDLGIIGDSAAGRIDGRDLVRLAASTPLALLNDGNGVGRRRQGQAGTDLVLNVGSDTLNVSLSGVLAAHLDTDLRALNNGNGVRLGVIRLTDRAGRSVDVDLADTSAGSVQTVGDLRNRINEAAEAAGVSLRLGIVNSNFQVTDSSGVEGDAAEELIVEDLSGYTAADLGIAGRVEANSISGKEVYRIETIGDVLNAINYAAGSDGRVQAELSADGNGIVLRATDPAVNVTVSAGSSTAARDLGLEGASVGGASGETFQSRPLLAGLNTVLLTSLNGGRGLQAGTVSFTDGAGATTLIDFAEARTLSDVIDLINAEFDAGTSGLRAGINAAGNGVTLEDFSGGTAPVSIADQSGSLAAVLGLAGDHALGAGTGINGGNLQRQYVTENTTLAGFNNGAGVATGTFRITDSSGAIHAVTLTSLTQTIGDVIEAINNAGGGSISARINDTGDGIVVIDQAGGTESLKIEDDENGSTARDLRLAGTADAASQAIDGSLEIRISVGGRDTLQDLANRINNAGVAITASIINDGSGIRPFSLSLASKVAGAAGEMVIDAEDLGFRFDTLSRARDAVVSVGGGENTSPILVTSNSNTLEDAVPGLTVNLVSASDDAVNVSVAEDVDAIAAQIKTFVDRYNELQQKIDDATRFNDETFERGPLQGDRTVAQVRSRLQRLVSRVFNGSGAIARLTEIGIRPALADGSSFTPSNNRLSFDEEQFREAYANRPEDVISLFTAPDTGFGALVEETLDDLTRDFDGLIARRDGALEDQQELLNDRIDALNELIEGKRARLEAQFAALESALAALQDQQNSLGSLSALLNA